jgi:membrane protein required for colicin V production
MPSYDIIMVAILAILTTLGAWKGMAWQLASLASLVLSYVVALKFSEPIAPLFGEKAPWNQFVAMLVLYLATSLVIWVVFKLVAGFIARVRLQEFDRQIGLIFGFANGVLLCLLVTFFTVSLSEAGRQAVLNSYSGYTIAVSIRRAIPLIPPEIDDVLGPYLDKLDEELAPATGPKPAPPEPASKPAGSPASGEPAKPPKASGAGS